MLSLRKRATQIVRNSKNSHRFVYFIDGKIRTFSTHIDDINSQVAALFGALNAMSLVRAVPAHVMLGALLLLVPSSAFALDPLALPTGYTSVSGNVQFSQSPGLLNVTTGASKSIVNYNTFDIGSNARVNFNLPSSSASILNRVTSGNMSQIYGTMTSNGRVFLVNPAGIFFGKGVNVSVNGLVASTLGITDQKFLAGQYEFTRVPGSTPGQITIEKGANINILNGGSASFLASSFVNDGNITANGGAIQVGIGDRITLGDDLIGITVNDALKDTLDRVALVNNGNLTAEQVKLLASMVKHDVTDVMVNNSGRISANKVVDGAGGTVELIAENGIVNNSGVIYASGTQGGQISLVGESSLNSGQLLATGSQGLGGNVQVLGDNTVAVGDNAFINVSGKTGGGSVFIGGDYMGGNPMIRNALYTYVGQNVAIKADAQTSGNGGKVIVWGSDSTGFYGDISAQGGLLSGNGGFVETSGKNYLDMQGNVNASALSANGTGGTWLLDPRDVKITNKDSDYITVFDFGTNTWVYNPTSIGSNVSEIKASSINSALNLGTNVTVHTGTYGTQPGDITVSANINKTSGSTSTLSLLAADDIIVTNSGGISANGNAKLNIVLKSDYDVGSFNPSNGAGSVTLNSAIGTGNGFVDISGVSVNINSHINAGTGNLTVNASGGDIIQSAGNINAGNVSMTTNAGNISQTGGSLSGTSLTLNATGGNIAFTGGKVAANSLSATTNTSGKTITFNDSDFSTANLKSNNGNITYNDRDGVTLTVDAGTGTANIVASTVGVASNDGVADSDLTLVGNNKAQTMNLTAKGGNINQSGGSIVGTTLNATTESPNKSINLTNADFSSVDLKTKFGDITYTDTDGVSAHFDTGNATTGTVNITAGNGANLNGGAEPSGLQITGANQSGVANLTAKTGNVSQASGSINTITSNLTAENGGIVQSGGSMNSTNLNLKATNGDVSQSNGSMTANNTTITTVNGNINQTGGSINSGSLILDATGGNIASTGGTMFGNSLSATTNTNGKSITLNDTDFASANLKSTNGDITLNDRDGLSLTVDAGTGNTSIKAGTGINLNASGEAPGIQLVGNNKANTLSLTSIKGNVSQAVGSTVAGSSLIVDAQESGKTINLTDADFGSANLKSNNGNITYNDRDGVSLTVNAGTANANITASALGVSSNNGVTETDLTLTGDNKANNLSLTGVKGNVLQAAGSTVAGNSLTVDVQESGKTINLTDADFTNANLKSNNGNITYNDRDGVSLTVNAGTGNANITASAPGVVSNNGVAEADLILTGDNKANSLSLTGVKGNISQTVGSTIAGNSLTVNAQESGKTINLSDADFTTASLQSNNGDITYNDRDGVSLTVNAGTGNANIVTFAAGVTSNNGVTETDLTLTGDNRAQIMNLTANGGNITQSGGTVVGTTLNAITTAAGKTISLTNADFGNADLKTNLGDITYTDTDGVSVHFDTGSATTGTVNITAGNGANLNGGVEASGLQITGANQAGVANLTAKAGNISQTSGSLNANTVNLTAENGNILQSGGTMSGVNLTALTNSTPGKSITLNNVDFASATLKTQNGTITYSDSDGADVNVNAGAAGTANITTGTDNTANNGLVENGLQMIGVNLAGTFNLVANHWDITQALGSTMAGTTLNTETKSFGRLTNITDADFNVANLKSNNGNITYNDADSITVNVQAGNGTVTINSKAPGLLSNNGLDGNGGLTLTGSNTGITLNLTAYEGTIGQTSKSTIQGQTLFAETKQSGKSINLTDTDFSNANLKSNNGNITLNDSDSVNVNVQAGSGTANIASDVSSANSSNAWDGNGLNMVGNSNANTMNLTANAGDITQDVGSTLSGNNLNVKTNNGQVILDHDNANDFNNFSASSKRGDVSYRDINSINITSVDLNSDHNSSLGNLTVQTNGAGNITQTGNINGVNTLHVITDTGNVILTNTLNNSRNLVAESNQGNVSYRDIDDINVSSANLDKDNNDVRGSLSIQTSLGGDITQTGNIIGVDTLKLRTDLGNAYLTLNNNVNNLDTGSNYGSTFFTNTKSFVLTGANMNMNNLLWKGDLSLTALTGQITQTSAINASELKITGNAVLTNANNNVDVFSAFGNGNTVSYTDKNGFNLGRTDVGNGTLNLGALSGEINQDYYFPILSLILRNRNITDNGGITAGTVNLNLGSGANAYLTDNGNAIGNFSLLGSSSCVKLVNSTQLNLTGANDMTGVLDVTVLNGQNLTQTGALSLNGLKVTMQDGGDFDLSNAANDVNYLSANASGINTQLTQGSFVDGNGGFSLAASDMNQGDLSLTALNGGSMNQAGMSCGSGGCHLPEGGLRADELKVTVVDGGDVDFTTQANRINSFSANATGYNTISSQIRLANTQDLNLASSNLNQGDLGLILQNGANLNQNNLGQNNQEGPPQNEDGPEQGNVELLLSNEGNLTHSRDILTNGGVTANELSVTMIDGGSADLTTQANHVDVFSGNALGATSTSVVQFSNRGDLNIAQSDVGQGKLYITTQGNLNNDDLNVAPPEGGEGEYDFSPLSILGGSNRDITFNHSTIHGDVVDLRTGGTGSIDIFNNVTATTEVRLTTGNSFGAINIHPDANVEARTGSVYINSNKLTLDGLVQGQLVQLWPWDLNLSMGIAGGPGGMLLSQGLVNHINTDPELGLNTLMFGHRDYTGTITLGSLNMSHHKLTDVAFNAPRVFDATPNNDSVPNLIMATNRNVYFTAGANTVADWASAPGGISFGDNNTRFADLDVKISGSGLIHVKLLDYVGVGNAFSIFTGGGNKAFINTLDEDNSGSLKNYGSALSARAGSVIINEIKGNVITLPGNPVNNNPTNFGSVRPIQFIPNQSL